MKKRNIYTIALLCATAFCGCYSTHRVVSYRAFDNAVNSVAEEIGNAGFTLVDAQHSNKQEPSISTRSHAIENVPSIQSAGEVVPTSTPTQGFQGNWSTDYTYTNTYRFSNKEGETMTYAVSYRTGIDMQNSMVYVREAYVSGCETSNPAHFELLCGEHSPIHRLDCLEKDTTAVL